MVEALDSAFATRFWAFVEAGDYEIRQSSKGAKVLYRFQKPKAEGYPVMLELFSRAPEGLKLGGNAQLTPLPIDEAAGSLSAILLDERYYEFLKSMVREAGGIPVLDEAAIIPFKARAWLDLTRQRAEGSHVDEKNIRKHRNDVARLLQLLSQEARYELPGPVADDMLAFVENAAIEDDFGPRQFKVNMTCEDVAARLRAAYHL
ncbi:hypothetical protein SmB9_01040 [Sphingosinicella microcystinivorans]|uniref:Nucleotidyltransferase AbiEii toxin of type IV toxin-antitoxin system n=1 Tax=Sphingosinicella microcystinivorans TaxID=335406 RepID=A0AAD1D3I3_SPHMI|nr:hypothetical protein SmB9_01040 [Sphingosinicella microcystinivorans]